MVVAAKSINPLVSTNDELIVTGVPITHPTAAAVLFIVKVPKFWKPLVKLKVPTLPVPNNVKLEVELPLKVPVPEMEPVLPLAPMVKFFPLISIMSLALPKVITFVPVEDEEITTSLNN